MKIENISDFGVNTKIVENKISYTMTIARRRRC